MKIVNRETAEERRDEKRRENRREGVEMRGKKRMRGEARRARRQPEL